MYNITYETNRQSRFVAWYWMLGAGALGRPRGMVLGGRGQRGSGWGCCVASVVSDSVRPHRRQPTRLPRPRDSPGKNTGVGCHFLLQCMKVKSEREVITCIGRPKIRFKDGGWNAILQMLHFYRKTCPTEWYTAYITRCGSSYSRFCLSRSCLGSFSPLLLPWREVKCFLRADLCLKSMSQQWHLYGRSPLCIFKWFWSTLVPPKSEVVSQKS